LKLKTVSARDLFWVCRHGDSPIIIDPRPKLDHDVYSIMGAISLPFDSVNIEDEIKTMPINQPVYVHSYLFLYHYYRFTSSSHTLTYIEVVTMVNMKMNQSWLPKRLKIIY
jgi:hypothetical protein